MAEKTDLKKSDTCTVACKIPNGLLLRLGRMVTKTEVIPGGTRDMKVWEPVGESVKINGPARPLGADRPYRIIAGYALTEGVPSKFIEEWLKQNEDHDAVKNNLIFVQVSAESAADQAKEHRKTRSNMEPLNPVLKDEPRNAKRSNPHVSEPQKGDKEAA